MSKDQAFTLVTEVVIVVAAVLLAVAIAAVGISAMVWGMTL